MPCAMSRSAAAVSSRWASDSRPDPVTKSSTRAGSWSCPVSSICTCTSSTAPHTTGSSPIPIASPRGRRRSFRKYVIEVSETRILPFLNIGATGMLSADVGELEDVRFIDRARALATIEAHRDLIRGVKVRLSRQQVGDNVRIALRTALETAEAAGLPIMVHVGDTPIPLDDILRELRR